jgi:hypothetical protein
MKRLNHGPDVMVFESQTLALPCSSDNDIDHGGSQVVGPNYLVREQHQKSAADRAHKPTAEIRFLPWSRNGETLRAKL